MCRKMVAFAGVLLLVTVSAFAQESSAGAGRVEISAFPGGGLFFTESNNGAQPDFASYALGGSCTVNANRWIGFEGELGGSIGIRQNLMFNNNALTDQKTPHMLGYSGNVVVSLAGSDRAVVPYATVGVGGLTMFDTTEVTNLGVARNETFLTGNLGGGVKWFSNRHWGVRADYRFVTVKTNDTSPAFFGRPAVNDACECRYAHRVYGGLLLTY